MAEQELSKERLIQREVDPKLYYDYEGRFIKQKLERERMQLLPRVVKPAMFSKLGWALGDPRVFERYSVAPLSALTCRFLELGPGEHTERQRLVPSQVAYIVEGGGGCVQDGESYSFSAEDVVLIPPYTATRWEAGPSGFKAWLPQVRLWHVLGLLWQEQLELQDLPEGTEPIKDGSGKLAGYRVPAGVLGLERDLEVRLGADKRRQEIFEARRSVREAPPVKTEYDWFLKRLADENRLEAESPRVIRASDRRWEDTRQGRLKFYIDRWTEVAAQALDVMATEIEPQGHTGEHRHIFEEMALVLQGRGHDTQENTQHQWEAGDIICVPPMTAHQHFNDGDEPVRLLSVWSRQLGHEFLGGIEHIKDASSWRETDAQ
jgi:quercetin dioxygenase-like cupin family protein